MFKLIQLAEQFNVSLQTICEILRRYGYVVDCSPNAPVTVIQYRQVVQYFKKVGQTAGPRGSNRSRTTAVNSIRTNIQKEAPKPDSVRLHNQFDGISHPQQPLKETHDSEIKRDDVQQNKKRINRINELLKILNEGLYERELIIAQSLLAAVAGCNIFLYGPPGTSKSLISRRIARVFNTNNYFEYLLQRFSTPEEVFGPVSIEQLKQDNYVRKIEGYLPTAEFAFIDEIWKASPAILNTLLTIINEKKFKNGKDVIVVPLKTMISASNETPPPNQGLEALYDRFLMRIFVGPISERSHFETLIKSSGATDKITIPSDVALSNDELERWRKEIESVRINKSTLDIIHKIRVAIDEYNKVNQEKAIYVSDRRWQKIGHLLKTCAYLCGREETNMSDCWQISNCIWSNVEDRAVVDKIMNEVLVFDTNFVSEHIGGIKGKKLMYESKSFYTEDEYVETVTENGIEMLKVVIQYYRGDYKYVLMVPKDKVFTKGLFKANTVGGRKIEDKYQLDFEGGSICRLKEEDYYNRGKFSTVIYNDYEDWRSVKKYAQTEVIVHKKGTCRKVSLNTFKESLNGLKDTQDTIAALKNQILQEKSKCIESIQSPFISDEQIKMTTQGFDSKIKLIEEEYMECSVIINRLSEKIKKMESDARYTDYDEEVEDER